MSDSEEREYFGTLTLLTRFIELGLEIGPRGTSAVCEQTGEQFSTYQVGAQNNPDLALGAFLAQVLKDRLPHHTTIYWRVKPQMEFEDDICKVRARLTFGPVRDDRSLKQAVSQIPLGV